MIDKKTEEKDIFYLFEGSVILKGLHAIIEIIGGFLALLVTQNFIIQTVLKITQDELNGDSKDFLANYLLKSAEHFSLSSQHFVAFYLLSHGIIKGILVIALLKKKLWAYPVSIFVFGVFMVYQIIRYTHTRSIWLIWHEYKIQKNLPTENL